MKKILIRIISLILILGSFFSVTFIPINAEAGLSEIEKDEITPIFAMPFTIVTLGVWALGALLILPAVIVVWLVKQVLQIFEILKLLILDKMVWDIR